MEITGNNTPRGSISLDEINTRIKSGDPAPKLADVVTVTNGAGSMEIPGPIVGKLIETAWEPDQALADGRTRTFSAFGDSL